MGNPSLLRLVPTASATVPIDWTKVPEASKFLDLWGLDIWGNNWAEPDDGDDSDSSNEEEVESRAAESELADEVAGTSGTSDENIDTIKTLPLPTTIGDLAKRFDESKFFGYLGTELCTLLLDISEFGLAPARNQEFNFRSVGPHFYMRYQSNVWFILFEPGRRGGVVGCSPDVRRHMDDLDEEASRDKTLAEVFDRKLCDELERWGTLGEVATKRIAGWEGYTLKNILEKAQMADAIMELPNEHPMHRALVHDLWTRSV